MSLGISSTLTEVLTRAAGVEITSPLRIRAIGGGSINTTYHITTSSSQQWFCKKNDASRFPDLFVLERQGLALLEATSTIRVPRVIACEDIDRDQVLILEWIDEGLRSDDFWKTFGRELAALHQQTGKTFGLDHDNYMGALSQSNKPSPNWVDFFINQRLEPQVALAVTKGLLNKQHLEHFHRLYKTLPDLFDPAPPSRATPVTFVRFQHCWTLARSYTETCGAAIFSATATAGPY